MNKCPSKNEIQQTRNKMFLIPRIISILIDNSIELGVIPALNHIKGLAAVSDLNSSEELAEQPAIQL
jgi:hypothetical protein